MAKAVLAVAAALEHQAYNIVMYLMTYQKKRISHVRTTMVMAYVVTETMWRGGEAHGDDIITYDVMTR